MRRVVVTPTFAAGLGVVVAAVLAYPMQTVFSYVAPGAFPPGGAYCGQQGCRHHAGPNGQPAPFGSGAPNQAKPGSAKTDPGTAPGSPGQVSAGGTSTTAQPELSYRITRRWQGGFRGQVTIRFPGAVPPNWRLRLGYPAGHILGMSPASRVQADGHAVVVLGSDYARGSGPGGRTFAIGVSVQGKPARPARCSFDGQTCSIG